MGYVLVFIVGAVAGGAAVWFFKEKALKLAKEAEADLKEKLEELKNKGE